MFRNVISKLAFICHLFGSSVESVPLMWTYISEGILAKRHLKVGDYHFFCSVALVVDLLDETSSED